jgi:hypothetical protein
VDDIDFKRTARFPRGRKSGKISGTNAATGASVDESGTTNRLCAHLTINNEGRFRMLAVIGVAKQTLCTGNRVRRQ